MDRSQARLAGVVASFVLALIVGAITGFTAPENPANTNPAPRQTSTTPSSPSATQSQTTTTSRQTPSQSPPPVQTSQPDISVPTANAPSTKKSTPSKTATTEPPPSPQSFTGEGLQPARATPSRSSAGAGAADLVIEPTVSPIPTASPDTTGATKESSQGGFSGRAALVGFLGAFLTGLVVVAVASSARAGGLNGVKNPEHHSGPHQTGGPGGTRIMPAIDAVGRPIPDPNRSDQDRAILINALIHVRDRATSAAIEDSIDHALREVGVVQDVPVGQRFDPTRHDAGGFESAPDAGSRNVVSGVEVMGYRDRDGVVLRAPVVTVYR